LQRQFESRTPFFLRFCHWIHQDSAERRRRKLTLWHFKDARPVYDGLGEFVKNGWRKNWRRGCGTRKLKNPCACFLQVQTSSVTSFGLSR
jgi:hypothetical protein